MEPIVVISGPIAAGKSTLCEKLVEDFEFNLVKTNVLLAKLGEGRVGFERLALQEFGESLDVQTKGDWIRRALEIAVEGDDLNVEGRIVIDSVKIEPQIRSLRDAYGNRIVHIHLWAPDPVLERRFKSQAQEEV
jgi:adenylosuccinate synthase